MNVNDLKGRLKGWTVDGYLDADLRAILTDSLAAIEQLERRLSDWEIWYQTNLMSFARCTTPPTEKDDG